MEKIIVQARRHFKKADPLFYKSIRDISVLDFGEHDKGDAYHALVRAILGQQLSVKAAQTIYLRFLDLFDDSYPDPHRLVQLSDELLRERGVSRQKAGYVKNVAQYFIDNRWLGKDLSLMDDDEVISKLTSIKGVGVWTVQMLLMFTMKRKDIFPVDDLGIQKAMKSIYQIGDLPTRKLKSQLVELSSSWSPFRTIGCMYLWRYTDEGEPI